MMKIFLAIQTLFSLHHSFTAALNINLPGGRSIEYNGSTGVLRIKLEPQPLPAGTEVPPVGTLPEDDVIRAIEVKKVCDKKGYGAFAKNTFAATTFLGFYEGRRYTSREMLDEAMEDRTKKIEESDLDEEVKKNMYPRDYVMSIDGGVTFIDGFDRAQEKSYFCTAHLNHADKGTDKCNVVRILEEDRVAFFTSRQIVAGEELQFDYGSNFWKDREHHKV